MLSQVWSWGIMQVMDSEVEVSVFDVGDGSLHSFVRSTNPNLDGAKF